MAASEIDLVLQSESNTTYGSGILLGTRDVTDWPLFNRTGYVGLGWGASSAFLDDFGGGTVVA